MNFRINNKHLKFFILLLSVPLLFFADILLGSVHIPLHDIVDILMGDSAKSEIQELIILQSRLPKALTAIISGAALSLSGLQMQTLFRNPLAGPYILGISSGAALGVAILVLAGGLFSISGISSLSISLAAMMGAALVLLMIFLFSLRIKDIMTVLIVGIMIGSVITAVIGILQYASSEASLKTFLLWSLGSLEGLSYKQLTILSFCFVFGTAIVISQMKQLNLLLLGESYAKSMGMNINKVRALLILSTSILAGSVTAFCGPIGFIGIIVPHLCRMIFNSSNHLLLVPASILMGISMLLLSDILSQLPHWTFSLPINSVTSIIGIPIILWIVLKSKSISKSF